MASSLGKVMGVNKQTILWVDNDPQYTQPYVEMLRDAGYVVIIETTVGDAKRRINETPTIDLAILDVMIPSMDQDQDLDETHFGYKAGVALGRWIKENHPSLPFVGLSVRLDKEIAAWFEDLGAGFATKYDLRDVNEFLQFVESRLNRKMKGKRQKRRTDTQIQAKSQEEPALSELHLKLETLEKEYELARMGMVKGLSAMIIAFIGVLLTVSMAFGLKFYSDRELLSGTHIVIIILILAFGLIAFSSLVFGRAARLRAQISETKKEIELITGEKVR